MIERAIPRDIMKHKSKMFAGLTGRQLLFTFLSVMIGLLTWFSFTGGLPIGRLRIIISVVPSIIPLLFGFVTIQDEPLEKIGANLIRENILTPPIRKKEIHYPEQEKQKKVFSVLEEDGTIRPLKRDKNGKIIVTRSKTIQTIR